MKKWRTVTRPNGEAGQRETIWGLDAITAVVSILALVLTASLFALADRLAIAREAALTSSEVRSLHDNLPAIVSRVVAEVDARAGYLTRAEWEADGRKQDAALAAALASIEMQLGWIQDGQRHDRGILEKLPHNGEGNRK